MDIPGCLIQIDETHFKCPKYGFVITTDKFPINCGKCNIINMNTENGPSISKLTKNFTKAMVKFVKNGLKLVDKSEYEHRISVCNANACGFYENGRCLHPDCGCFLSKKCWLASENCPLNLWENSNNTESAPEG